MPASLDKVLLKKLTHLCGKDLLTDESDRYAYSYDNSREQSLPDAVIFVRSHEQIAQIIELCYEYKIPVVARGRGTGTTGGAVPVRKGIVLSFERMNKITLIDPDNRFIIAEPGVTNTEIQLAAAEHDFFWPPDPSSADFCSIGGNLGFNSAGPRAVKYGTTRDSTLGLRAVTGTGESIKTGVCTTKGVVGYDLTRLLIGSEGTLAVITEATLKLLPKAEVTKTIRIMYQQIESATDAVAAIMRQSVTPCALEFMDAACLKLIRQFNPELHLPENARAMLIVEVDGLQDCIERSIEAINQAAHNPGLIDIKVARNGAESQELWLARKALSPALRTIAPRKINEDVVVPVSKISALIRQLEDLGKSSGINFVNFGHAGNGNIHVNLLIDPDDPRQMENAQPCLDKLFDMVLAMNGTLSGEHGVGLEKMNYISREIDAVSLRLMKQIKLQFDPANILNPGKLFV